MTKDVRCYLVEKNDAGEISASVANRPLEQLPEGDVLIRVAYSSLNYKDALAARGHPGVASSFPHVPGIDAAGVVESSSAPNVQAGDRVLVTGYELGSGVWGGYADFIRVPADWVVPLPAGLSLRESMIYGTAGFTAAMSLDALQLHDVTPQKGEIVVTGASGGVGSLAVAILAKAGYQVAAVTGKDSSHALLEQLGAARTLSRDEVNDASDRPLLPGRWAGAVDAVGGKTLATVLRATRRGGCVAACGLVGGAEVGLTVYPFILRGVTLSGIDSAQCLMEKRRELWAKLAGQWKPGSLEAIATETVGLDGLPPKIDAMLKGQTTGRIVVRVNDEVDV